MLEFLNNLKADMFSKVKKGPTNCPCCGSTQALYTKALSKNMAKGLVHLTKDFKPGEEFHLINYFFTLNHKDIRTATDANLSKLSLFGLIEEAPSKAKGYYVYSDKTVKFMLGAVMVPEKISTYNNVVVEESRNQVTLKGALKDEASYPQSINWKQAI